MTDKKSFILTYDLCEPGQNYEGLIDAIKTYNWCKIAKSAWIITSTKSSVDIRDHLKAKIDKNDKLFLALTKRDDNFIDNFNNISKKKINQIIYV